MSNSFFNEETALQPVLVVRLEAKEGKIEELIKSIKTLVEHTRKEDGNICYNVYQDIDTPSKVIFYEVWKSEEALIEHSESNHIKSFKIDKAEFTKESSTIEKFERSVAPIPENSKDGLVLFANIKALQGKELELQPILEKLIPLTMAEEGAEHYELHKLKSVQGSFMFHETWTTVANWDAHMLTEHLVEFLNIKENYVDGGINLSKTKQIF